MQAEARELAVDLVYDLIYGVIKTTSSSMTGEDLDQIYDLLMEGEPQPALSLIRLSLDLDRYTDPFLQSVIERLAGELENRPVPSSMLRRMVIQHLMLFHVPIQSRAAIAAKLDFRQERIEGSSSSRSLTPSGRPRHVV